MANFVLSPSMSLPIPVIGVDPGPDYASNLNNSLTIVDGHDHSAGYGVQISPSGININSDLPFGGHNAINLRTVRLQPLTQSPSGAADVGAIFELGVDLYYIDGASNVIRLTQNGSISAAAGNIANLTSPASAAYSSLTSTFVFESGANIAANIDGGSLVLRPLTANSAGVTLSPPAVVASAYSLILPTLPSQLSSLTLDSSGNLAPVTFDQVGQAMTSVGANAIANTRTRAVNSTAPLGGIALAPNNSGNVSITSSTPILLPNQGVILTCGGNPISLNILGAIQGSAIQIVGGPPAQLIFAIHRNGSILISFNLALNSSGSNFLQVPPGAFNFVDFAPAGVNTYELFASVTSGTGGILSIQLMAYEI